jgi:hypothetical protein
MLLVNDSWSSLILKMSKCWLSMTEDITKSLPWVTHICHTFKSPYGAVYKLDFFPSALYYVDRLRHLSFSIVISAVNSDSQLLYKRSVDLRFFTINYRVKKKMMDTFAAPCYLIIPRNLDSLLLMNWALSTKWYGESVSKLWKDRYCSVPSPWRPHIEDKRMVLEYTHGLFIT